MSVRRLALLLAALLLAAGCVTDRTQASPPPGTAGADLLAQLEIAPEAGAGYDRDLFGDYDRPAVLAVNRDSYPDCGGYWSAADAVCHASADAVEVDHLVALAEAWDSGASTWGPDRLNEFGGATGNLWLMTGALNGAKSDADPVEWLPPAEGARCWFASTWVEVKAEWSLTVDQAERNALAAVLTDCPGGGS